jgi:ATP-dependent helicase HrpB
VELPVFEIRDEILAAMGGGEARRVLLRAPTGSGKSTAVPLMLLKAGAVEGRILVVQPRRIAARMLAEYVSKRNGTRLGEEVGYAVRFDRKYSAETRVVYLTDGVLQRWMQEKPWMPGVGAILFDEFHERRLASDLALARTLDLQENDRPDLKLMVMSATLETGGLREYLAPCQLLEAGGRMYPVEVEHRADPPPRRGRTGALEPVPVWERVGTACREALGGIGMPEGGERVLVFLPGAFEIRKSQEVLESAAWARGWEVKPLYSALAPPKQWEAVEPGPKPRIILATNVAETSITIDGIKVVVDAGTARKAAYDPRREIDTLTIRKISRASAEQRAGRAGRTGPGRCLRLWSAGSHAKREEFERPEVRRVDLAEAVLYLKSAGVRDVREFRWLEAPEPESLKRAEDLLASLGATDGNGRITELGTMLGRFPLHPRQARLLAAALAEDCVAEACFAAAVLQGDGVFTRKAKRSQRERFQWEEDWSDFEAEWRACEAAAKVRFDPKQCGAMGIQGRQARETLKSFEQLCKLAQREGMAPGRITMDSRGEALARAMLAAYRNHVGVRTSQGSLACRVVGGRRGKLDEASVARNTMLLVAAEMTEVQGRGMTVHLNRGVRIERAWLEEFFPGAVRDEAGAAYDETARRVVSRRRLMFDDLVIEEKEGGEVSVGEAARLLAEQVVDGQLKLKKWDVKVDRWVGRVNFLANAMPELEVPRIGDEERRFLIEQLCTGALSYRDIKERDPWRVLKDWLSGPQKAGLESYAPERITLTNGVGAKVLYEDGRPPRIGLKVQQLYGVEETPEVAGKPVLVEVLAPNQRPWQTTQDLGSFWERGYAQMKKDLAGRYPKHEWR